MKSSLNKLPRSSYLRWIILFFIAVTDIWALKNPGLSFIVFLAPLIFVLLHSFKLFGKKHTFMIFGIIILVSFTAEYLGVHTGRVFGPYYYNPSAKVNGFLWAGVPPLVTFSYISMGYCSYVLSRIIFGKLGKLTGSAIAGVPIVAAMIMTMWDMSFDPIASYVNKIYTWYEGGAYFGVPFRNFTGWFLESLIFFLIIGLYLSVFAKTKDYLAKPNRLFLAEVVFLVAANAFGTISHEFSSPTMVQQSMAIVALFGLGMPVVIASFRLLETNKK
jgi:putative membrane protein